MLLQPAGIVILDVLLPLAIDLAGSVLALSQTLLAKDVMKARHLRVRSDKLGQMRRDEYHALAAAEDHIPGHHHDAADADRRVDAH